MKKFVIILFVLGTIGLIFALAGCGNPAGGGSGGEDAIVLTIECYKTDKTSPATADQMAYWITRFSGGTVSGTIITYTQSQFETLRNGLIGDGYSITATSTVEESIDAIVARDALRFEKIDSKTMKASFLLS